MAQYPILTVYEPFFPLLHQGLSASELEGGETSCNHWLTLAASVAIDGLGGMIFLHDLDWSEPFTYWATIFTMLAMASSSIEFDFLPVLAILSEAIDLPRKEYLALHILTQLASSFTVILQHNFPTRACLESFSFHSPSPLATFGGTLFLM